MKQYQKNETEQAPMGLLGMEDFPSTQQLTVEMPTSKRLLELDATGNLQYRPYQLQAIIKQQQNSFFHWK